MPYLLKHDEVRLADIGTLIEPHLYSITAGQRNDQSLIFHVKIGKQFHTLPYILNCKYKKILKFTCLQIVF